jgi:effector-binding domain-containing protein
LTYEITIVELPERHAAVISGHVEMAGIPEFLGGAFGEVMSVVDIARIAGPPFARYSMPADGFDIEAGFPVTEPVTPTGRVEAATLPGGPAATLLHRGSYEAIADAYGVLMRWVSENGYLPTGAPWESYLDEPDVPEPRTLVTVPVRRATAD